MPRPPRRPRRLLFVALATISLVALGDWLFFDRPLGWSTALFTVALLLAVLACGAGRRIVAERSWRWAGLTVGVALLAATMALEPRVTAASLALAALWTMALWSRQGSAASASAWLRRLAALPPALAIRPLGDAVALGRIAGRRPGMARSALRAPLGWLVPLGLSGVFIGIFMLANPVLDRAGHRALETLRRAAEVLLEGADPARAALWALVAALGWTLMRARTRWRRRSMARANPERATGPGWAKEPCLSSVGSPYSAPPAPPKATIGWASSAAAGPLATRVRGNAAFAWRCLLLFNVVFAVQTTLDIVYLAAGAALPDGMTYASYAHRGAYPLIAAALLAGVFTLAVFRPGLDAQAMRPARLLLVPWIGQSIVLTATAAWRLWLCFDTYGLTRWRVAAAVWMGLVAIGLLLVVLQVVLRRDGEWLLRRTLGAAIAALALWCFPDWEGAIAWHNVRHCGEIGADAAPIDVEYLQSLGPAVVPALVWLRGRVEGEPIAHDLDQATARLRARLAAQLDDWRGWTIRRALLRRALGPAGAGGAKESVVSAASPT